MSFQIAFTKLKSKISIVKNNIKLKMSKKMIMFLTCMTCFYYEMNDIFKFKFLESFNKGKTRFMEENDDRKTKTSSKTNGVSKT